MIVLVSAFEHQVITALVSPVVGFAVAHKQHSRMVGLYIVEQRNLYKGIPHVFIIESCCGLIQLVEQFLSGRKSSLLRHVPSHLHHQVAAGLIENVLEYIPSAVDSDLPMEFGEMIQPFK